MRNPRYKISFGYMTKPTEVNGIEETRYGGLKPRLMNYEDLEYMLKILNPFKSEIWLNHLSFIKRGDFVRFELDSVEDNGLMLKKVIRIERN